jgi:peptidoglycan/xylan/chitin deacetylase (PgdA/CDA1 family)
VRHKTCGSRLRVIAAPCIVILLVAAGCANPSPSIRTHSPVPATSGLPTSNVPSGSPVGQPSPSPVATSTRAPVYPVVNSCDPGSVPGATQVGAAIAKANSLTLHVPILEYHRIVPFAEAGNSLHGLVVPPDTFAAQLDALKTAGWQTITMATLAHDLQAGVKPPSKTFVITIDDGWDDGYTYALPVLAQHAFVATYFVIADRIDQSGFLTSAHLRALVAAGDEIGDHTMSHFNLTGGSAATRQYQVDAAAARIAQVTDHWPESLAYPFGGENAQAVAAVAACRELWIAVIEGPVTPEKPGASQTPGASKKPSASPTPRPTEMPVANETWANRFTIPRIRVGPGTTSAELLGELDRYLRAG